jgi:glucose/mannose-6-phosphate isomerase
MLDDLKYIAQKDTSDALGVAEKTPAQLQFAFDTKINKQSDIKNVVVGGMGGSALAASLFVAWPGANVPFVVNRQYDIPGFVGPETLFIGSSYSGNTEESLEALGKAKNKGAQIVLVSADGRMSEIAAEKNYPLLKVPSGLQPRMTVFYQYRALAEIMESVGLASDVVASLESSVDFLEQAAMNWRPDMPTQDNLAKQLAEDIAGKTPVIYAGPALSPAAYKWKISFNENAKNVAFYNQWPEFNHNEFIGWTSHPIEKPFQPIELISAFEHERVLRRFEISNRLLSGQMPHPIQVQAEGNSHLEHLLWTVLLGDFVTIYVALLNGLDPTPVELIERLKTELNS